MSEKTESCLSDCSSTAFLISIDQSLSIDFNWYRFWLTDKFIGMPGSMYCSTPNGAHCHIQGIIIKPIIKKHIQFKNKKNIVHVQLKKHSKTKYIFTHHLSWPYKYSCLNLFLSAPAVEMSVLRVEATSCSWLCGLSSQGVDRENLFISFCTVTVPNCTVQSALERKS